VSQPSLHIAADIDAITLFDDDESITG